MPSSNPIRPIAVVLAVLASVAAGLCRLAPITVRPPNFTPIGALGLYAGGRLPWWIGCGLPLAVMAATDFCLWLNGLPAFNKWVYASFLIYVLIGRMLCRTRSPGRIAVANYLGAIQFFLVTNFGVWLNLSGHPHPMYPSTGAGLLECYIAGLPFFGYTLAGDLFFSAVLFGAHAWLSRHETSAEPALGESA